MTSLNCPQCSATCLASEGAAELAGRRLRCPHCQNVWRLEHPARPQAGPRGGALVPYAPATIELTEPLTPPRLLSLPPQRARTIIDVYPPRAARSAPRRSQRRSIDRAGIAACLLAAALIAGAVTWRAPLVALAPGLGGLYALAGLPVNLRGLEFSDLRITRDTASDSIVVHGTVTNVTDGIVAMPAIRLAYKSAERELYTWQMDPPAAALEPGATVGFSSELIASAAEATALELRFTGRHQQIARFP